MGISGRGIKSIELVKLETSKENLEKVPPSHLGMGALLNTIKHQFSKSLFVDDFVKLQSSQEYFPLVSGSLIELKIDHINSTVCSIDFSPRINRKFDRYWINQPELFEPYLKSVQLTSLWKDFMKSFDSEYAHVQNIWFEYDAPYSNAPALFFDLDLALNKRFDQFESVLRDFNIPFSQAAKNYWDFVNEHAFQVRYMGIFFGRSTLPTHRFTMEALSSTDIIHLLKKANWKGSLDALQAFLQSFPRSRSDFKLSFDFGHKISERIGIEWLPSNIEDIQPNFNLHPILKEIIHDCNETMPLTASLSSALSEISNRPVSRRSLQLNHLKTVFEGDIQNTKVYLYLSY